MDESKKHFAAILDPVELEFSDPIEIIPGHFIRRASPEETRIIREEFHHHGQRLLISGGVPYEFDWVAVEGGGTKAVPLPAEQWRYAVVSYTGYNEHMQVIGDCLSLITPAVELGFSFIYMLPGSGQPGVGLNPRSFFSFMSANTFNHQVKRLARSEIEKIGTYFQLCERAKSEQHVAHRAIASFRNLKMLPRDSDAYVLLSFAIIESLVTHKPKLLESVDSITHQVHTKFVLLKKRFDRNVEADEYFGPTTPKNLWASLYAYRSAIAHGQDFQFKGAHSILKNKETVCDFLNAVIPALIVVGLREPNFLEDLRAV